MKQKKGFTLIELMVAMGIIAVLVTMSVVAIQIVQRSLRDTQRRDVLNTVNLWLAGFYNDNGQYPRTTDIEFRTDGVYYSGTNPATEITEASGATAGDTETSSNGTDYCYNATSGRGSFQLGLKLESGSEVQLGNDPNPCTAFGT